MWLAAIDPQWPPTIGAIATLLTALGVQTWRHRRAVTRPALSERDKLDRAAAETILVQWQAVLEATKGRAEWAESEHRRCEERNDELTKRVDALEEKNRAWEWEVARRDWLDERAAARRRKRTNGA